MKTHPTTRAAVLPYRNPASGFTLLELIVVVAIIGILASLLLPCLAKANARAKSAVCLSQLRQIGIGMELYANSHEKGYLPTQMPPFPRGPVSDNPFPYQSWLYSLREHLGDIEKLRFCPMDRERPLRVAINGASYVLNEYTSTEAMVGSPGIPRLAGPGLAAIIPGPDGEPILHTPSTRKLGALKAPSATIVVFEGSDQGAQARDERTHPDLWFLGWEFVTKDIDPHRHGKSANYLFADWHVESIAATTLRRRIELGDNFALPPQ